MQAYSDPSGHYTIEYPDSWIALAEEGTPHLNLASSATGGQLHIEAYRFDHCPDQMLPPEAVLRRLAQGDRHLASAGSDLPVATEQARDGLVACTDYDRPERQGDYGHVRLWAQNRGWVQVRCVYRCRRAQAGTDDEDLALMLSSLEIHDIPHLDVSSFGRYYFSLLKRHRPQIVRQPPSGLTLTLRDGQSILLEQVYNHYLQEPDQLEALIEAHINLLDFCGDDVPDLGSYPAVRCLLFPKLNRAAVGDLPPHRLRFWPGLAIGAVVQGSIFHYGVNTERLHQWGFESLQAIWKDLVHNLHRIPSIRPRALRNAQRQVQAISYTDHPFGGSFLLFEDFYETTAENLGTKRFLVAVPEPGHLCCLRGDNPRFVAEQTSALRWLFHRSLEPLTDAIYLVVGPRPQDARPFDVTRYCVKRS